MRSLQAVRAKARVSRADYFAGSGGRIEDLVVGTLTATTLIALDVTPSLLTGSLTTTLLSAEDATITDLAVGTLNVDGDDFGSIYGDVTTLQGDVTTLQGDVTTLQGEVTTLQGDVTTLQGDVTTLQGDVTTLQGDVTTLQGDVTTLQGDVTTLQGDVTGLQSDVGTLQGEMTTVQGDVAGLQGASVVTVDPNAALPNERVLTGTARGVTVTDGGAGGAVTLGLADTVSVGTSSVTSATQERALAVGQNTVSGSVFRQSLAVGQNSLLGTMNDGAVVGVNVVRNTAGGTLVHGQDINHTFGTLTSCYVGGTWTISSSCTRVSLLGANASIGSGSGLSDSAYITADAGIEASRGSVSRTFSMGCASGHCTQNNSTLICADLGPTTGTDPSCSFLKGDNSGRWTFQGTGLGIAAQNIRIGGRTNLGTTEFVDRRPRCSEVVLPTSNDADLVSKAYVDAAITATALPALRATRGGGATSTSYAAVAFPTTQFARGIALNADDETFTPPADGYYRVHASVTISSGSNFTAAMRIRLDGNVYAQLDFVTGIQYANLSGEAMLNLTTANSVFIEVQSSSGSYGSAAGENCLEIVALG